MAYDEVLAWRIRAALSVLLPDGVRPSERVMFGGRAFMVYGHMTVAASGGGGMLARVDPADTEELLDPPRVQRMVMRGREMDGWLRIADEALADDVGLRHWVQIALDHARHLPPG